MTGLEGVRGGRPGLQARPPPRPGPRPARSGSAERPPPGASGEGVLGGCALCTGVRGPHCGPRAARCREGGGAPGAEPEPEPSAPSRPSAPAAAAGGTAAPGLRRIPPPAAAPPPRPRSAPRGDCTTGGRNPAVQTETSDAPPRPPAPSPGWGADGGGGQHRGPAARPRHLARLVGRSRALWVTWGLARWERVCALGGASAWNWCVGYRRKEAPRVGGGRGTSLEGPQSLLLAAAGGPWGAGGACAGRVCGALRQPGRLSRCPHPAPVLCRVDRGARGRAKMRLDQPGALGRFHLLGDTPLQQTTKQPAWTTPLPRPLRPH